MTWLTNLVLAWDEFLNAMLGGEAGQTLSYRAALARQDGAKWGCVLCGLLAVLIQRGHCDRTMAGEMPTGLASIRAAALLLSIFLGFILLVRLS